MDRSTIAAIATPEGYGGIGVIKVSGPDALPVISSVFRRGAANGRMHPGDAEGPESFESWRLYFGHIIDPDICRVFDEVILAVMRAPHSYTREDVVEIQAHAGPKVLYNILELLFAKGLRPAGPGEFTRRAFLNDRIDLTQAEAVADLINADSDAAVDMAVTQMAGGLKSYMDSVRGALVSALAEIEAVIDFPDAVDDEIDSDKLIAHLSSEVIHPVEDLLNAYDSGRFLREGLRAVIIGGPNVGKSSLLNRLVGKDRAIVTDIPGTTRDCIEAMLTAGGIPVVLADTAGLREDPDQVERLGIEKTHEYLQSADLVLFVVDAGVSLRRQDQDLFEQLSEKRVIVVINKSDLEQQDRLCELPPEWRDSVPCISVSALEGTGIADLVKKMAGLVSGPADYYRQGLVPNWRQKVLLDRLYRAVSDAVSALYGGSGYELVSVDLREALLSVDEITGQYVQADVLDSIFARHCVGK
ncbi:MAG: tRNA uridine-5-carboxymethylaminomethyl(34) synthesis GTPase MnmE [Desulfobacterales bacterium]|nr:tRNA uridine-5-carboxymethylaminomethyl(34) synthesis GTPase MnmE [Desulfobacterales bacterium]